VVKFTGKIFSKKFATTIYGAEQKFATKYSICLYTHVDKPCGINVNSGGKIEIMKIKIVCVGKLKERYWREAIAEYSKRLTRFAKVEIVQVPDEKAPETLSPAQMNQVKATEGERILSKIKDNEYVFVTAIKGKERTSEEFAQKIADLTTYGHSNLTFVIGGSLGTSPAVNQRGDDLLSFGKFTMPHQLMRLVLIEQIYRAFMINSGSPYHK
jgi:23S rRNA (pseudouridine1915-N3)-methyltransferase